MSAEIARELLCQQLTPRYGVGEARAIARIVFEDAFDRGRTFDPAMFNEISLRLISGEPVQYVLGAADFFGLKFKVDSSVLIPRQETEALVAWVLEALKSFSPLSSPALLDIGLGSGCIGITLKKKRPGLQLFGLEKSPTALELALENAARILSPGVSSPQFIAGDILNPVDWAKFPKLDIVVSNPPYIPHSEKNLVPDHVLSHEPALALFVDDPDPLLFYRVIADFSLEKLNPDGLLFFECNEFNAPEVARLLEAKGFSAVELRKDLAGAERMVKAIVGQTTGHGPANI
jgi:release factor glutamine methyltransferase